MQSLSDDSSLQVNFQHSQRLNLGATHPDYDEMLPVWDYLEDLYYGVDRWLALAPDGYKPTIKTKLYLPQHPGEDTSNWEARINQTYFDNLYAKALHRYVDLAFQNGVRIGGDQGTPFSLNYSHLGDMGQNGCLFLREVALSALLYGRCFLMIDSHLPPNASYLDAIENPAYFVKYNPRQVTNWGTHSYGGETYFSFVVVSECVQVLQSDLSYVEEYRYRLYTPGWCHFYKPRKQKDGSWYYYSYAPSISTGLDYIPIYLVSGGYSPGDKTDQPPMRSLADKNRSLYQMESDHIRKISLCCHPVPTLKDNMRDDDNEPLVIGPNTFVRIRDPEGSFTWQEPLALSLQQSRKDIQDLKGSIANDMAQFLNTPTDRQSSAATNLMVSPVEANLESFITSFTDGIDRAIAAYNDYSGVTPENQNYLILNPDIFPNSNKDAQASFAVLSLYNGGVISRETALKAVETLNILPDDFDLDSEMDKPTKSQDIAEQQYEQLEQARQFQVDNPLAIQQDEQRTVKPKQLPSNGDNFPRGIKRVPKPKL